MSEFDSPRDVPFQLRHEGEKIRVTWQPGVPTQSTPGVPNSAQGTVSWNIPTPIGGCPTISDGDSAYCGAIVVISTKPLTTSEQPKNGEIYVADPTASSDAHAGDTIGNALVIGAFYEGEKKANGKELTTSMVVNDVDANTPYYVGIYAVDCQFRYHRSGAYAYSREYGQEGVADSPGSQVIELGSGVNLYDDLPSPFCAGATEYKFDLLITDTYPDIKKEQIYPITVNSGDVCTYSDLIFQIRKQLIIETINRSKGSQTVDGSDWTNPEPFLPPEYDIPDILSSAPRAGTYCVENGTVFQFNGATFDEIENAFFEPTDPDNVIVGDYWFNPETQELKRDRIPDPSTPDNNWNLVDFFESDEDPTDLTGCDDYWFDGTNAYLWKDGTWCKQELTISTTDPTSPPASGCVIVWFDESTDTLLEWDSNESVWKETAAIMWPTDPTQLPDGTYWFNDSTCLLFIRQAGAWTGPVPVVISEDEPIAAAGTRWFIPSTEELRIRDITNTNWVVTPVLVWPEDPAAVESCDKWWATGSPEQLFVWDSVHAEWDLVDQFFISETDPLSNQMVGNDTLWYNPDIETLQRWNGVMWIDEPFINQATDPTMPTLGTVWRNPSTDQWFVWGTPTAGQWNEINPIDSTVDPKNIPVGYVWYDTDDDLLFVRETTGWKQVAFDTECVGPSRGSLWYDESEGVLKEWNGREWVQSFQVPAEVELNEDGHLKFTTRSKGSQSVVMVFVPEDVPHAEARIFSEGCGPTFGDINVHSFAFYGPESCPTPLKKQRDTAAKASGVNENNFLFGENALSIALIRPQVHGFDGLADSPAYLIDGVGTDGTSDERKALSNFIREQLGYPIVEVELSQEQIDNAIRRALDVFRQKSSLAYTRGFFFLDIHPGIQSYSLTSRRAGYNKIVNVMGVYRFTSAFLSTAHGAGVYGQIVLQHLYNMGTYDLTSFHMISQYIEQLEHLFATRLTFHYNEPKKELTFYTAFVRHERVLVEASVERTEQEILTDRLSKNWIERWALAESQLVLARIRGKYASLPGAGGGIALDAADLVARAEAEQDRLILEIEDYYAADIEDYGMGTTFLIG